MKVKVQILLFSLFFVLSFLVLEEFSKKRSAINFKKKNNPLLVPNDDKFQKILKKYHFLKSKEEFLSKQGNPLHFNSVSYYTVKVAFAGTFFVTSRVNFDSVLMTTFLTLLGYYFVDGYIYLNKKARDAAICTDLMQVSNSISLQLSANIMLKDSLKQQFEICQNPDFKRAMLKFSTKYELSELDIEESLKELESRFDIPEIELFCNSLRQYNHVENMIEVLDNLSEALKEKYLQKMRDDTRSKVLYITFGVFIALGNMILITFYPLFVSLGNGFSTIFNS